MSHSDFIGNLLSTDTTPLPPHRPSVSEGYSIAAQRGAAQAIPDSPNRGTKRTLETSRSSIASTVQPFQDTTQSIASHILRYALLFVNMMFVLSSMLMVVAGTMVRGSLALILCEKCRDLAITPIVLGGMLWLFAMYGFYGAKRRNVTMLIAYGVFIVILSVIVLGVLVAIATLVLDDDLATGQMSDAWSHLVRFDPQTACHLQSQLKCSGFSIPFGKNGSLTPPAPCDSNSFAIPCQSQLQDSLRHGLVAFLVLMLTSFLLLVAAMVFAWALKSNRPKK